MLTSFSSFVGCHLPDITGRTAFRDRVSRSSCHLHEPGHIQITIAKYPLGIFLLFRNTAPSKKAGNITNFIYSMTFCKIKYHNKTIRYIYKYSISDERSSCVLIRSNLSLNDTTYKRIELPRCTPIPSNDMIFCIIVMNPNSLRKWYVIILH